MDRPKLTDDEIKALIPGWVYNWVKELFNPVNADKLPPRRLGVDYAITMELG